MSNKELSEILDRLQIYNDWRTGKIDKTMEEAKIEPSQVTKDINFIIGILKEKIN